MSFLDSVWDQIKSIQEGFDGWVARNISRKNQNIIIVAIFFILIIHLVYTKRKLTREAKERLMKEAEEQEKARSKKKVK